MSTIEIFLCYAREDELLRQGLEKHLRALRRQGVINVWHDREISAGTEWQREIDRHLNTAQIILLLISPDFMDSDYCYSIEMQRAMERYERGETQVIPIILRPVYWQGAPFGKLQALPKDAKHVTGPSWHSLDEAFFDVAEGIRKVVEQLLANSLVESTTLNQEKRNLQVKQANVDEKASPKVYAGKAGWNENLRRERFRRGWSQNDVAERVGSDVKTVGRWERGTSFPGPYHRQKLAEIYQMSLEELGLF